MALDSVRPLPAGIGYTGGMKTAISIPDDVFAGAERLAKRTRKSRSRLFSDAVREYLARHAPEEVTEAMDRTCSELGCTADEFTSLAVRRILERSEW
jgi:metal-responsive CopG/Arc/MetJ family transcriptional regulator